MNTCIHTHTDSPSSGKSETSPTPNTPARAHPQHHSCPDASTPHAFLPLAHTFSKWCAPLSVLSWEVSGVG